MDDDAQLERELLLARRLKLAVRLVFYPLLVGALLLALHIRHAQAQDDVDPPGRPWHGTGEGVTTADLLIAGGKVTWSRFFLVLPCDDGSTSTFDWTPDGGGDRQHDGVLTARRKDRPSLDLPAGVTGTWDASLEVPIPHGDAPVTGTVALTHIRHFADGRTVVCGGPQAHAFTLTPQEDAP